MWCRQTPETRDLQLGVEMESDLLRFLRNRKPGQASKGLFL